MGFVRDVAKIAPFGLMGQLLKKKKKPTEMQPQPTMISSIAQSRPTSMIGPSRGGY